MEQLTFDLFANDSKPCSTCGIAKPLDDFSFDNRRKDGRQARCRDCVKAYQKRYRQADREHYLEIKRAEHQRGKSRQQARRRANRERLAQQQRERVASLTGERLEAHRASHRKASEAYRAKNPDLCSDRIKAWKKANPDKILDAVNRRRAWQYGNGPSEKFTRAEIGDRDGWICGICDESIDKALRFPDQMSPSIDHITPLSLGGLHTRANSRITHWICNVRRGNRERTESAPAA